MALLTGSLLYFFWFYRVFNLGSWSTMQWASRAWNSENDLEYGWAILPVALGIAWYHRHQLLAAPKSNSWMGLLVAFLGAATFLLGVRALQPRISLVAMPILIYGSVLYLWGKATARLILFPCAFLLFMVPMGFLVSRTVGLQTLAATVAARLSSLCGIGVVADGTILRAVNGAFEFEVAGGCSGIRSLTAMTVLAALFVHFTQRGLWKKAVIFVGSLLFALVGNLVRIFTVVLVARFISPKFATSVYHDYSGFIFFPVAVLAMLGVSNLLNRDWSDWVTPEPAPASAPLPQAKAKRSETKTSSPISYDY